jgi:hypothetical protein
VKESKLATVLLSAISFCILCGFSFGTVEEMPEDKGTIDHNYSLSYHFETPPSPQYESGPALKNLKKIGFWNFSIFKGDIQRQVEFILWMKKTFEEVADVIILDQKNGTDFSGVTHGGWAWIGGDSLPLCDFKSKKITRLYAIEHLNLTVCSTFKGQYTDTVSNMYPIWRQDLFVDKNSIENIEMGYKILLESLLNDWKVSNEKYDHRLTFTITLDDTCNPHLLEVLKKHISISQDNAIQTSDKNATFCSE